MRYIWRSLFTRKVRTGLSMLGVSVSVAGVVALISVAEGMRGSLDTYMESTGASLLVFSDNVADLIFSSVSEEEIEGIRGLDGVEAVSRSNFYMTTPPPGWKLPIKTVLCFGRFPDEPVMQRYQSLLTEGRLLRSPDEVMVSRQLAESADCHTGDKLPLLDREFEVVGIFEPDIAWENLGVILHADVIAEKSGRKGNYTVLFVYTDDDRRDEVRARIPKEFPGLTAVPSNELTSHFSDQFELLDEFIAIITVIAIVIGVLGVLNTMMMSVSERTREIGMLRALGWSRGRIVSLIFCEGVLLSLFGGVIGIGLGVAGTETLVGLYPEALVARYLFSTFVTGFLVGFFVGVLAAVYPAYRAANLRPVEALRYE